MCSTVLDMPRTQSTPRASIENAFDACTKAAMRVLGATLACRSSRSGDDPVQKARKSSREQDLGPRTSIDKLVESAPVAAPPSWDLAPVCGWRAVEPRYAPLLNAVTDDCAGDCVRGILSAPSPPRIKSIYLRPKSSSAASVL